MTEICCQTCRSEHYCKTHETCQNFCLQFYYYNWITKEEVLCIGCPNLHPFHYHCERREEACNLNRIGGMRFDRLTV